jgi:hypothetical protein
MFCLGGRVADMRRGWTRRDCLQIALSGAAGYLGQALGANAQAATKPNPAFGQAKSCIYIYLFGGPSHIDIWDMKPDAPAEIRGEFRPISTNVPGLQITEHLPRLAAQADRYAIIRSLTHGDNSHGSAGHAMMTGYRPRRLGEVPPTPDDCPHFGSVLARLRADERAVVPFVQLPQAIETSTAVVPGQTAGFLGQALDPLRLDRPLEPALNFLAPLVSLPAGLNLDRIHRRSELLRSVEEQGRLSQDAAAAEMAKLYRRAFQFLNDPKQADAFLLEREPAEVRQRYGMNVFGQSLLLARRLVEAGVQTVSVVWPDRTEPEAFVNNGNRDKVPVALWDTHGIKVGNTPNFPVLRDQGLPVLDQASSALLDDLTDRGLLDRTLVVWTGEFGRSPKINTQAGRDHYGSVFSAMLAGGGIQGGQAYGSSDKFGAFPRSNPVSPADFAATLFHCLGVRGETELHDRLGRPLKVCQGRPIGPLLGS